MQTAVALDQHAPTTAAFGSVPICAFALVSCSDRALLFVAIVDSVKAFEPHFNIGAQ